jgi:hypothetical protein
VVQLGVKPATVIRQPATGRARARPERCRARRLIAPPSRPLHITTEAKPMFWLFIVGSIVVIGALTWFGAKFSNATRRNRRDY